MKRLFSIMMTMLLIGVVVSPIIMANNDRGGQKVNVSSNPKRGWQGKNLQPEIKIYYYPKEDILELTCYETKETTVYVLTASGEELSCDTFNSDMTPFYTVDAPDAPGTYWIVIDSPVIYAEGTFIVE